jgi:hypothetical protein
MTDLERRVERLDAAVTRGAPAQLSGLNVPARLLRPAATTRCPECRDVVPTRDGRIAGHYAVATQLCTGSSKPVQEQRP